MKRILNSLIKENDLGETIRLVRRIDGNIDFANGMLISQFNARVASLRAEEVLSLESAKRFVFFTYPQSSTYWENQQIINLGDYVQTIATQKALSQFYPNYDHQYWDRDNLFNYYTEDSKSSICVMNGFFGPSLGAFPNKYVSPVFIGFHLGAPGLNYTTRAHRAEVMWGHFIRRFPRYMRKKSMGCRDKRTAAYLRSHGLDAYFSRCLSMTLSRRQKEPEEPTVFICCQPHVREVAEKHLPKKYKDRCETLSSAIDVTPLKETSYQELDNIDFLPHAEEFLTQLRDRATLVITDRVHVASPCIAMGIPTIIIKIKQDDDPRYDFFEGVCKCYTLEEARGGKIDFEPDRIDIEPLKELMLTNLHKTIEQEVYGVDCSADLREIRQDIAAFRVHDLN